MSTSVILIQIEALVALLVHDRRQWFSRLRLHKATTPLGYLPLQVLEHGVEVSHDAEGGDFVAHLRANLLQPHDLCAPFAHLAVRDDGFDAVQLCQIEAKDFVNLSERFNVER